MSVFTNKQFYSLLGVGVLVVGYLIKKSGDVADSINPLNNDNVFSTSFDKVGAAVTGDKDYS